jgi:hypothetical protein
MLGSRALDCAADLVGLVIQELRCRLGEVQIEAGDVCQPAK